MVQVKTRIKLIFTADEKVIGSNPNEVTKKITCFIVRRYRRPLRQVFNVAADKVEQTRGH
jgi:hypothetical protein